MSFLLILGWLKSNIKYVAFIVIAIVCGLLVMKLYGTIKENGANQVIIETLQGKIEQDKKNMEILQKQIILNNYILQDRDEQLAALQEKYDGLTDNLGPGENDNAPDSIKEYFKRLQGVQ